MPLLRHSPLPELQDFVSSFRPKRVVPNTLLPGLGGLDWLAMDGMFSQCLAPTSRPSSKPNLLPEIDVTTLAIDEEDVTLKNLEGPGVVEVASRWADVNTNIRQGGRLIRILEYLLPYLPAGGSEKARVSSFLRKHKSSSAIAGKNVVAYGDDTDSDDSAAEEARERTARKLFADVKGGTRAGYGSLDSSSTIDEDIQLTAKSSPNGRKRHGPFTPHSSLIHRLPPFEQIPLAPVKSPAPVPLIDLRNTLRKRTSSVHSPPSSQSTASPSMPSKRLKVGSNLGTEGNLENLEILLPSGSRDLVRMSTHTSVLNKSSQLSTQSRSSSHLSFTSHNRVGASASSDLWLKAERLRIAERLSQARPDLVVPTYHQKRAQQLSWITKTHARDQYLEGMRSSSLADIELALPWEEGDANDSGMDLERSRVLTEMVRHQVERKQDITLPALECLDSQQQQLNG